MAALDLLGRRWSLRVLWELRHGPVGARALRTRCDDMSPSVLYQRLAELADAGLVERADDQRYQLTQIGRDLGAALIRWTAGPGVGPRRRRKFRDFPSTRASIVTRSGPVRDPAQMPSAEHSTGSRV